ncbi:class C sortase [Lacticaseibacillus thailandensis]|uniref:Sortase n=1 Tax=Lacticaseibacillus thailandensis DSM 22698 = JCM 13996 TaxID=1423810 RepID=A0A0R2CHH0_9LACO|nr:class C sortase [Lacticaseibacillus thailandensis]KRM87446.1 hypothetical protein FD19_GL000950 [Lacticaseibacillus thailandensis DSM 22698 = JCM 13996]
MQPRRRQDHWAISIYIGLIIVGFALLLAPTVYSHMVQQHYQRQVTVYQHQQSNQTRQTRTLRQYNQALARHQAPVLPLTRAQQHHVIGYVSAPRIHLINQPIYYGDDDTTLSHGVGVMPGTSLPIGGRSTLSVISGHSGFNNQIIFDNIRHLHNGDRFYVTALGQPRHAYRVYKRIVVDPNSHHALAPTTIQPGRDITVLLTCTPIFINSHRLLIFGRRVPITARTTISTNANKHVTANLPHWFTIVVAIVTLCAVIAITWWVVRNWSHQNNQRTH